MTGGRGSSGTLRLMIVAAGDGLVDECRDAVAALADRPTVVFVALGPREALETARARQPHAVILDGRFETRVVAQLAIDLQQLVPGSAITATLSASPAMDTGHGGGAMLELLRAGVRDFLQRPVSPVELGAVFARLLAGSAARPVRPPGRVITFTSNKGGVGKSTLSVNVAGALAQRHPGEVLLIDASLQLGVCAYMLGLSPSATLLDAVRELDRLDDALLRGLSSEHSTGLRLLAAPLDALEAADVTDDAFARLLHVARHSFDYVIVDTFPLMDGVVMSALDASDLVFVVLQAMAPSVAGVARLLPVLDGLGFDPARQRIVLNRNHRRFLGDLTSDDARTSIGRSIDFTVPYDGRVLAATNAGEPLALRAAWMNTFRRAILEIVEAVEQDAASGRTKAPSAAERRTGADRRVRDVGHPGGERRSGRDRRAGLAQGRSALPEGGRA